MSASTISQASHFSFSYLYYTSLTLTASLRCPKLKINNFQLVALQDVCGAFYTFCLNTQVNHLRHKKKRRKE